MQPPEGRNEQRIKQRAYQIWEEEGRPEGRAQDHWRRAEAEPGVQESGGEGGMAEPARSRDTAQPQAGALKGKPSQGTS